MFSSELGIFLPLSLDDMRETSRRGKSRQGEEYAVSSAQMGKYRQPLRTPRQTIPILLPGKQSGGSTAEERVRNLQRRGASDSLLNQKAGTLFRVQQAEHVRSRLSSAQATGEPRSRMSILMGGFTVYLLWSVCTSEAHGEARGSEVAPVQLAVRGQRQADNGWRSSPERESWPSEQSADQYTDVGLR